MQKTFHNELELRVWGGRFILTPVGELREHLAEAAFARAFTMRDCERGTIAFELVGDPSDEGPRLEAGGVGELSIGLPYDDLTKDGRHLYRLLEGSKRIYPVSAWIDRQRPRILVEWPTMQAERLSRWPDN